MKEVLKQAESKMKKTVDLLIKDYATFLIMVAGMEAQELMGLPSLSLRMYSWRLTLFSIGTCQSLR